MDTAEKDRILKSKKRDSVIKSICSLAAAGEARTEEGCTTLFNTHFYLLEQKAEDCHFSLTAQLIREIADLNQSIYEGIRKNKRSGKISKEQLDEAEDLMLDLTELSDEVAANALTESCGCRLR